MIAQVFYSEMHLPHKKQTSSLGEVEEAEELGLPTGPCRERSCSPTSWHLHVPDRDTVKVRHGGLHRQQEEGANVLRAAEGQLVFRLHRPFHSQTWG